MEVWCPCMEATFAMDFPLGDLLDPQRCYAFLVSLLHPSGLGCPNGHPLQEAFVHKRDRTPILDYRCKTCGRCFNVFTGTVLRGIKYNEIQVVQLLHGIAEGKPTAQLAREMGVDRKGLLIRRHQLQSLASQARSRQALPDPVVEVDEMYQNAGEKRRIASRSGRSPSSTGQQAARARNVGAGSTPGVRNRRSSDGTRTFRRRSPQHARGTGTPSPGRHRARRLRKQR